jgi:hypothetical protein
MSAESAPLITSIAESAPARAAAPPNDLLALVRALARQGAREHFAAVTAERSRAAQEQSVPSDASEGSDAVP